MIKLSKEKYYPANLESITFDGKDGLICGASTGVMNFPIFLDPSKNTEGLLFFAEKGFDISSCQIRFKDGTVYVEPYDKEMVDKVMEEIKEGV